MSKAQLVAMARKDLEYGRNGMQDQADSIHKVPIENYYDQARWEGEKEKIFRRMPLMLATTAELKEVGDYKAMEAAGVQVIITRTRGGGIKAFVN
ncbi:MAG: (2Fe-2S)-binding protein, partial [Gammaproteobacteria bacterium]|nr:(2Fe-2S)-binding protein [Gammaproteobacteria bacterium]